MTEYNLLNCVKAVKIFHVFLAWLKIFHYFCTRKTFEKHFSLTKVNILIDMAKKITKISIGKNKAQEVAEHFGKSIGFVYAALAGRSHSEDARMCVDYIKQNYEYRTIQTTF